MIKFPWICEGRRGAIRRSQSLRCEVVRERDFRLVADEIIDLSANGALVKSVIPTDEIWRGDSLLLSFYEPTIDRWFDVNAFVSRVIAGRRRNDRAMAFGLRFEGLDFYATQSLKRILRGPPPPLPPVIRRAEQLALPLLEHV